MMRRFPSRLLRRPRRLGGGWLLLGLGVAVLLAGSWLAVDAARRASDAASDLRAARAELRSAADALGGLIALDTESWPTPADFAEAKASLHVADERLSRASDRLGYLRGGARLLGWAPRWGDAVSHGPDVLALGRETVDATIALVELAEPVFEASEAGDSSVLVAEMRSLLVEHGAEMDAALARLEEVRTRARGLATLSWEWPLEPAASVLALLEDELSALPRAREAVAEVSMGFDALFGFGEPRTYLVMGQNDHEMRATGGFLGTIGSLTIAEGQLGDSMFGAVQSFEQQEEPFPDPPEAYTTYHGGVIWRLRDMNWDPDFPRSAEAVMQAAEEHAGLVADGALAMDTRAIELMIGVFEPLDVPVFEVPITSNNWRREVETAFLESDLGFERKENFLDPVMDALIARMQSLNREELPPLLDALRQAVEGRHLQIYSRAPEAQRLAEWLGAGGLMVPSDVPEGVDYLSVIDTNLSASKVQPAVSRDITYLRRQDGLVDVTVQWTNDPDSLDLSNYPRLAGSGITYIPEELRFRYDLGVFGDYVRFYLPDDAVVTAVQGMERGPVLGEDRSGLVILEGFVNVPKGESRTVQFTYLRNGDASAPIFVRKQGGQQRDHIRVLVNGEGNQQHTLYDGPLDHDLLLTP